MSATSTAIRGLGLAVLLALTACPAANAAVAWYDEPSKTFRYKAAGGESNDVNMILKGRVVRITDPGASILTGDPCRHIEDDPHRILCKLPVGTKLWRVSLGDGDDVAETDSGGAQRRMSVSGGSGDDELAAHGGPSSLYGEAGRDLLVDDDGDGKLSGGDGPDALFGGPGFDLLIGGPGVDQLYGQSGRDTLDASESDGTKDAVIDCGSQADKATLDPSEAKSALGCESIVSWQEPSAQQPSQPVPSPQTRAGDPRDPRRRSA